MQNESQKVKLLAAAKPIASEPFLRETKYWWLSDTEILILKPAADEKLFCLTHLDLSTGQTTPLDTFNQQFSKMLIADVMHVSRVGDPRVETVYLPPRCDLSPNRKWFLWLHDHITWMVASLEGEKQGEWWPRQYVVSSYALWLPNSTQWVELFSYYQMQKHTFKMMVIHNIDSDAERVIENLHVDDGIFIGVSHHNQVLIRHAIGEKTLAQSTITSIDLKSSQVITRQIVNSHISNSRVSEVAISDSADRLAWILETGTRGSSPGKYKLCISNLFGEEMRELGWINGELQTSPNNTGGVVRHWPCSIRWTPDGNGISFIFKKQCYVLDVM